MKNTQVKILLIIGILGILWVACKKEEFPEKTFVGIDIDDVQYNKTRNKVEIRFNLLGLKSNDPFIKKTIELYKVLKKDTLLDQKKEIAIGRNNIVIFEDLIPNTNYCFHIIIETGNQNSLGYNKFTYLSQENNTCFITPSIDIKVIDDILELDTSLSLVAKGEFIDFNEADINKLIGYGHKWEELRDTNKEEINQIKYRNAESLNRLGQFTTSFPFYDLDKFYRLQAYFVLPPNDTIFSQNSICYTPKSEGNVLVRLSSLPNYDTGGMPPREGAVSFVLNGIPYVGLGYNKDYGYLNDFWYYDPKSNTWREVNDAFPAKEGGRMFAVSAYSNFRKTKVYVGTGCSQCHNFRTNTTVTDSIKLYNDFYEFNGRTWSKSPVSLPDSVASFGGYAFLLKADNKIYYSGGVKINSNNLLTINKSVFRLENSKWNQITMVFKNADRGAKYGGAILEVNNNTEKVKDNIIMKSNTLQLIGGGTLLENREIRDSIFQTGGDGWEVPDDIISNQILVSQRLFAHSFTTAEYNYLIGGEKLSINNSQKSSIMSFDLLKVKRSTPAEFTSINFKGAAPFGLTRGISFSVNNRGYFGLGRTGVGEVTSSTVNNNFWMYIPPRKK